MDVTVPRRLQPAVERVEHSLVRIVLRPVVRPPPLALALGATVMALLVTPFASMTALVAEPQYLPLLAIVAAAALGPLAVVYLAVRGVRALHIELTPHQLRIRVHDLLGMRSRAFLRTEIREASLCGSELEVRTWDAIHRFPVPERATQTRDAVQEFLSQVCDQAREEGGGWRDVPPSLRRTWTRATR